eukprot:gene30064-37220_t
MKCSSSAKNKMQSMVEQGMKQGSMSALDNSSIRNWVLSTLLSVSSNQTASTGSRGSDMA